MLSRNTNMLLKVICVVCMLLPAAEIVVAAGRKMGLRWLLEDAPLLQAAAGSADQTPPPIQTSNCSTRAKIVQVSCAQDRLKVLFALNYTLSDGTKQEVCNGYDATSLNEFVFQIPPDDGIYAIRVCYQGPSADITAANDIVGIRFSAISKVFTCGTVTDNPNPARRYCYDLQAPGAAPLAVIGPPGTEDEHDDATICTVNDAIFHISSVCWNRYYVSPFYPPGGCPAGQGIVTAGLPCKRCPRGWFNPGGLVFCAQCAPGTTTTYLGATSCGCKPGTGWTFIERWLGGAVHACGPCKPGTFATGGSKLPCTKCPGLFMTSPPAARNINQCTCQAGYGVTQEFPTVCQLCPRGTFSRGTAAGAASTDLKLPATASQAASPFSGPSLAPCVPCCDQSLPAEECQTTTLQPGATSFAQCVSLPAPSSVEPSVPSQTDALPVHPLPSLD